MSQGLIHSSGEMGGSRRLVGVLLAASLILGACTQTPSTDATTSSSPNTSVGTETSTTDGSAAPGSTSGEQPEQFGDLRIAVTDMGAQTFDPIESDLSGATGVTGPIYDFMVNIDGGEIVPGIAESWTQSDDGLTWVFNIRQGVKWADGTDLTGRDVKFSLERYMEPEAISPTIRDYVESVELVDDYTVEVTLSEPQPFLLYALTTTGPPAGQVMPMDYINEHGVEYFQENPMGSGPWNLVSYSPSESLVFEAKEEHWRSTPEFETMTILQVPELSTQLAMLRAGEVDMAEVLIDDVGTLESEGFTIYELGGNQGRVQFHATMGDPRGEGLPTSDIRVRQALALAVDQDAINESLLLGKGAPRVPPRTLYGIGGLDTDYWVDWFETNVPYDPEEAQRLLEEAGYPDGFDIRLFYTADSGLAYLDRVAVVIQNYWEAIGVNTEIVFQDEATYRATRTEPADVLVGNASFGGMGGVGPIALTARWIWGSTGGGRLTSRQVSEDEIEIYTPEIEETLNAALSELDPDISVELGNEFVQMGVETWTAFPLNQVPFTVAVGPDVTLEINEPAAIPKPVYYAESARHAP